MVKRTLCVFIFLFCLESHYCLSCVRGFPFVVVESFAMGKLHKDIAKHMVQCAEVEEATEEQIIKVINLR